MRKRKKRNNTLAGILTAMAATALTAVLTMCEPVEKLNKPHSAPTIVASPVAAAPATDLAPAQRSTLDDYYHSGYDRGHMCPAADCKWSREAMKQSFYLSNICPQSGSLNGGDWQVLEKVCRDRTSSRGDTLYIISGPIFDNPSPRRLNKRVPVPDRFFKTIVCLNQGREYGVGFVYTNNSTDQPMADCACTIDQIEEITGYDLYSNLPKKQQRKLEAQAALP